MPFNEETRRTGRRASEVFLGGIISEVPQNPVLFNQASKIARRFVVGDALARAIAEHAFSNGGSA